MKGSGDLRSGSVCISSTFTIFLPYGPDYTSIPLCHHSVKLNIRCSFHNLMIRHEIRRWVLVLDAMYGCTAGTRNNSVPQRVNGAKIWPPLCQIMSLWHCVCPVGAPFSNSLQGTVWANCGTVCLHFSSLAGIIISWFQWRSCISHPI